MHLKRQPGAILRSAAQPPIQNHSPGAYPGTEAPRGLLLCVWKEECSPLIYRHFWGPFYVNLKLNLIQTPNWRQFCSQNYKPKNFCSRSKRLRHRAFRDSDYKTTKTAALSYRLYFPHTFTPQFSILTFIYIHIFCSFCSFCSLGTENACGTGLFSFVKEFVLL